MKLNCWNSANMFSYRKGRNENENQDKLMFSFSYFFPIKLLLIKCTIFLKNYIGNKLSIYHPNR